MYGDILKADFAVRLARAIPRVCDRVCDRALCVRTYDRACDRARDFTSLVSRSGAASPGGRLGASRQARQGRGSTPRGARARGSGLGCFATSGTGPLGWAAGRLVGCAGWAGTGPLARVWGWSGTRPARGFGPPLAGCRDVTRRGVVWGAEPGCATKMGRFVEKSMYQKRYENGRLAAVFDAIFV